MSEPLDLRKLAVDRATPASDRKRHRAILSRIVLPAVLLVGFAILVVWALSGALARSLPVRVIPVTVSRSEVQTAGAPLFQAAGWIEPRPRPMLVTALAEGVIDEVFVVEGQDVAAGDRIATLIDVDSRLELERAKAERSLRMAELDIAQAVATAARLRFENPLHLTTVLADAESLLAKSLTEQSRLPTLIEAADAQAEFARRNLEGKEAAGSGISGRVLQQARSERAVAVAQRRELETRAPQLEKESAALRMKKDAVARQLELLIDEKRQVKEADANVKVAEARVRQAELAEQAGQVRLDRMTVVSPRAGRVLSVIGLPGTRVMGLDPGGESKSSTVVMLYDPASLQVRVDVRLEDVAQVVPGQTVTLESAASSKPLVGSVLAATARANVQKNTLEVKVVLNDPPATLRPEMIVSATFLAAAKPVAPSGESESPERIFVPRSLVEGEGSSATVWVAAHDSRARLRSVKVGGRGAGELVEILTGLNPTDRLLTEGRQSVREGTRIAIMGEDDLAGRSDSTR